MLPTRLIVCTLMLLSISFDSSAEIAVDNKNITTVYENGGRVDVARDGRIAFDRQGKDGYFDVYVAQADASNEKCLTCSKGGVPQLNNGNPSWHPSGEWIVFQAQDPRFPGVPMMGKHYSGPGSGVHNDLWVTDVKGRDFHRLTKLGKGGGVLHPHFSQDGAYLFWAQRIAEKPAFLGQWALKIARFRTDAGSPRLEDIREYRPLDLQMYESHGFSEDGKTVLFTGCRDDDFMNSDIYSMDVETGTATALTADGTKNWDEHAHFLPGDKEIIWMSSREIPQKKGIMAAPSSDYWIMHADGTQKRRLTFFNDTTKTFFERRAAADWSLDPSGRRMLGYLINHGARYHREGPGPIVSIPLYHEDQN